MAISILDGQPKKVLMIAYAFPPAGGSGVQRPAKFAKYLPQFGWTPTIWTANEIGWLPTDITLREDVRDTRVHTPPLPGGVVAARRMVRGFVSGSPIARRVGEALDWRLASWRSRNGFPDSCADWARRSLRPLLDLIRSESIDLVFSTFSPASNHWLALQVKARTGLPWVAEFRDLWTDDYCYDEPCIRRQAAHERLQQTILEQADAVVGVAPGQTAVLAGRVPQDAHKFHTITNGFDPEDFCESPPAKDDRFTITFTGRFNRGRARPEMVAGLSRFARTMNDSGTPIRVRFAGHVSQPVLNQLRELVPGVEFEGYVSHEVAIRMMRSSDVLLLPMLSGNNSSTTIHGKVFEYLASGRPILVIGPQDCESSRIVENNDAGFAVPFEEEAVAAAFGKLHSAWKKGRPVQGCDLESLGQYSRIELTDALSGIFDQLLDNAGPIRKPSAELVPACAS